MCSPPCAYSTGTTMHHSSLHEAEYQAAWLPTDVRVVSGGCRGYGGSLCVFVPRVAVTAVGRSCCGCAFIHVRVSPYLQHIIVAS